MIVPGLLGPLFLSPEEILSDTKIDEIERAGGVDFNDLARAHLREIVRDYMSKRLCAPPTQEADRRMKRLQTPRLKAQIKAQKPRQKKLASALEKAAALLEEELRQRILSTTSLDFKVVSLNIPLPISLPQIVQLMKALAGAARVKWPATEQRKGSPGRRPDGLNDLIQQFAIVYLVSGGKLASGTHAVTGHGRITPVVKAAKALIDALPALPEDRPRPDLDAIAGRVKGQKLFAPIKQGVKPLENKKFSS